MARKRRAPADPFEITDDNAFLAALEAAVCARMAPGDAFPGEPLDALERQLDEINRALEAGTLSPEEGFARMMGAAGGAQPGAAPPLRDRIAPLTRHERLFLAVYLFDSDTYNDGIGHFFFYDSGDLYDLALEGLREIGAGHVAEHAQAFAESVFGPEYPVDIHVRQAALEEREDDDDGAGAAFRQYAQWSEEVTRQLAAWARSNRAGFRING